MERKVRDRRKALRALIERKITVQEQNARSAFHEDQFTFSSSWPFSWPSSWPASSSPSSWPPSSSPSSSPSSWLSSWPLISPPLSAAKGWLFRLKSKREEPEPYLPRWTVAPSDALIEDRFYLHPTYCISAGSNAQYVVSLQKVYYCFKKGQGKNGEITKIFQKNFSSRTRKNFCTLK